MIRQENRLRAVQEDSIELHMKIGSAARGVIPVRVRMLVIH